MDNDVYRLVNKNKIVVDTSIQRVYNKDIR